MGSDVGNMCGADNHVCFFYLTERPKTTQAISFR
jgi:hypothetical protein